MSLSPDDADSASPTVAASARISFSFLSAAVMIRRETLATSSSPELRTNRCRLFSHSNPLPPLSDCAVKHIHTLRIFSAGYTSQHSTTASRRSLRFPLATKETSDWKEAKKARSSTVRSGACAGCTTTEMFHLAVRAKQLYVLTLHMRPRTVSTELGQLQGSGCRVTPCSSRELHFVTVSVLRK